MFDCQEPGAAPLAGGNGGEAHGARHRPGLPGRLLAAGLGIDVASNSEAIPSEVIALARDGHDIQAIRHLRRLHGLGLLQAKRIVDAIGADEPT